MLSHLNILVTVLFVTSIQSLSFASMDTATSIPFSEETRIRLKRIVRFSRRPWIEGFKSILHTTESSCADDVAGLIEAMESGQEWAFQMLDASSSFPSGLMKGNFRDVGMYDECIEVNEKYKHVSIRGKHCMASLGSMSPKSSVVNSIDLCRIFSSLCVPSSCNETHVEQIINATIAETPGFSDLGLAASEASCTRVESNDWSAEELYTLIFFLAVAVVMIGCTICDLARRYKPTEASTLMDTFAKFSLYTNALAVLSTKENSDTLQSIEGIRVLSMCWVILTHGCILLFLRPVVNGSDSDKWLNSWASLYIEAAPFAVETFLLISGFFTAYLRLKTMKSEKRINWPLFYLSRYLRLTPSLCIVLLYVSVLAPRLGNGPLWNTLFSGGIETCQENWWINLLYLQNLVNSPKICLPHTWSLAVDMQLFWISPIIVYPLYRWPKHGIRILGLFLIASIVTPPIILAINGYSNRVITLRLDLGKLIFDDFLNFYKLTYNRASAYFFGIFLGYDMATKERQLTKVNVSINWVVTSVLLLYCMCATHYNYNKDFAYNRVLEVVLALTLRPCWSIAIAWTIYACTHGYGGSVNRFLSAPFFRPLSRISYSIYLLHFLIQSQRNAIARTPVAFSNSLVIHEYLIDLALSVVAAFVFTLCFESPLVVLTKIFVKPKSEANQVALA
ncbi:nose resistant to fluoxetine protein 6-like [Diprion similis]|uniref:nose resistant to fluoxetine protein 6-like n=1 Tax=Diprion similis TaxID=362088 RepID=UPI001EF937CC|nr:nose resistant to fluoxetine protein 6-like [Diprion similis]